MPVDISIDTSEDSAVAVAAARFILPARPDLRGESITRQKSSVQRREAAAAASGGSSALVNYLASEPGQSQTLPQTLP